MTKTEQQTNTPLFTRQAMIALILPLLLEQFLTMSMGLADTVMVSSVGEAAVSSVSLVDSINTLFIQILSALATGGAVVASQYLGRKDTRSAKLASAQLYTTVLISTLVVGFVLIVLRYPLLRLIFGAIDDDVMAFSQTYMLISALSYPFIGTYNAGAALFRAQGNSRISMRASLVMNVINVAGNALFIYVFGMGVMGAALATLIGRIFAACWVVAVQQSVDNPLRIDAVYDLRPQRDFIRRILGIGIPSGLENGMFQIGKLVVSHLTSTLGTAAIAANAVANTVSSMANIPGNAISLAMIPVVGQCIGADEKKQAKTNARKLLLVAYAGIWAANAVLFFTIPYLVPVFGLSATASKMCITVVHWFNLFSLMFWPASFTLPNALRAGGDVKFTMGISIFSMWLFRIILSYLFVLYFGMGLTGVWFGMFIDWVFRSGCFVWRFRSDKWMDHKVI